MRSGLRFDRYRILGSALAFILVGGFCASEAKADFLAFTAPTTGLNTVAADEGSVNLGLVFTANTTFMVDALGFYDGLGVTGSEDVALYDSTGTLLASTTVTLGGTLVNSYLFQSITPVTLTSGDTYTVDAFVATNGWTFGPVGTVNGVTFDNNSFLYSSALAFPTDTGGAGPVYYGPNFEIVGSNVPEPGSFGLLLIAAALASFMYFRKTLRTRSSR
jgi:hypothetical protein